MFWERSSFPHDLEEKYWRFTKHGVACYGEGEKLGKFEGHV